MTPEQKQRLKEVEENRRIWYGGCGQLTSDIDFLLSLVKSQEAGVESRSVMRRLEQQGAICRECKIERGYRPVLDYVRLCPRHAAMDNAATSMRSRCVEKLQERARHHFETARMIDHGEAPDVPMSSAQYIRLADELNTAANALESVSIHDQEPKQ